MVVGRAAAGVTSRAVRLYATVLRPHARVENRRGNPSSVATPQARVREWTGSVGAVVERAAELSGGFQRRRGDASGGGARAPSRVAEDWGSVRLGMSAAAPAGVATEKRPAAPEAVAAPEEEATEAAPRRRPPRGVRRRGPPAQGLAPRPVAQKAGDAAGVQGRARRLRGRVQARRC